MEQRPCDALELMFKHFGICVGHDQFVNGVDANKQDGAFITNGEEHNYRIPTVTEAIQF